MYVCYAYVCFSEAYWLSPHRVLFLSLATICKCRVGVILLGPEEAKLYEASIQKASGEN